MKAGEYWFVIMPDIKVGNDIMDVHIIYHLLQYLGGDEWKCNRYILHNGEPVKEGSISGAVICMFCERISEEEALELIDECR